MRIVARLETEGVLRQVSMPACRPVDLQRVLSGHVWFWLSRRWGSGMAQEETRRMSSDVRRFGYAGWTAGGVLIEVRAQGWQSGRPGGARSARRSLPAPPNGTADGTDERRCGNCQFELVGTCSLRGHLPMDPNNPACCEWSEWPPPMDGNGSPCEGAGATTETTDDNGND